MKNVFSRVALVAQISVSLVFVVWAVLTTFGVVASPYGEGGATALLVAVAVLFFGLSAYLLYAAFFLKQSSQDVLLYSNAESSTKSTQKVVKEVVRRNANAVGKLKLKSVKIFPDDKLGFRLLVSVKLRSGDATSLDALRLLCEESFAETLGVKFTSIDFKICDMKGVRVPDVDRAVKEAERQAEMRRQCGASAKACQCEQDDLDGESAKG